MLDDYEFSLCLTHDVDRVHKSFQCPYYAIKKRDLSQLKPLFTSVNPWWQFENIMKLEEKLGVRSSFYFLNEQRLFKDKKIKELIKPSKWKIYFGRYDIKSPEIKDVIKKLDNGGWEIGIHGSYESYNDKKRLKYEKEVLKETVGSDILGGRQHYLNLDNLQTWKHHRDIGLKYDSTLGSTTDYGFNFGYDIQHPFDDDFTVFPVTIMDSTLMNNTSSVEEAWKECKKVLEEAKRNNAIMTIIWHQRVFNEKDFSGYREIYEKMIKKAQEMGAWVGPAGEVYEMLV